MFTCLPLCLGPLMKTKKLEVRPVTLLLRITYSYICCKMAFPKRGLFVSLAVSVFLWLIGFPIWIASLFGMMGFLGMGGLQYVKLVIKTLPKDLWMGSRLLAILRDTKRLKDRKLYVSDLFQETVAKYPNKVAIYFEDQQMTFQELNQLSNQVANHFLAHGLQRGDCIAMFMENCPEYLAVMLGLSKIGVIAGFINHNLRGDALSHCIKVSNCVGLVFSAALGDAVFEVLSDLDTKVCNLCFSVCGPSTVPKAKGLEAVISQVSNSQPPAVHGNSANDKVCYIYTSGTTGLPKACNISHARFFGLQNGVNKFGEIGPNDTVYCTLPLYHTNGGILSSGQMLFTGASLVIRRKFSASNFWNDCIKYKCTVTFYIGEVCRYVLAQPKRPTDTQHCIRLIVGNGLRLKVWKDFVERFRIPQVAEFYGSTEGNVGIINPFNKTGACGRISVLLPFLNPITLLKVNELGEYVKDSNGFCVSAAVDEPGECVGAIKKHVSSSHFDGYTDARASSKKVMHNVFKTGDSYFLSGDILRMDDEGFLYFCDRTGDTFRWKGENVSTTEVEATMAHCLELTDVVVYGVEVPGNEGRAGMAAIVGTPDIIDLAGLPRQLSMSLPPYAIPLFVRLIKEAERTGTFKLKKVKLRNEGFDIGHVIDPLYMLKAGAYVPITEDLHRQLTEGTVRV